MLFMSDGLCASSRFDLSLQHESLRVVENRAVKFDSLVTVLFSARFHLIWDVQSSKIYM